MVFKYPLHWCTLLILYSKYSMYISVMAVLEFHSVTHGIYTVNGTAT